MRNSCNRRMALKFHLHVFGNINNLCRSSKISPSATQATSGWLGTKSDYNWNLVSYVGILWGRKIKLHRLRILKSNWKTVKRTNKKQQTPLHFISLASFEILISQTHTHSASLHIGYHVKLPWSTPPSTNHLFIYFKSNEFLLHKKTPGKYLLKDWSRIHIFLRQGINNNTAHFVRAGKPKLTHVCANTWQEKPLHIYFCC